VADWRTRAHLEDHYGEHRHELPGSSIEDFDASAQQTIAIGTRFTFREPRTGVRRIGYYHRESARFVVTDTGGSFVRTSTLMRRTSRICRRAPTWTKVNIMSVDTSQSQQQPPTMPEGEMLDAVRRRLIEIHYGLAEATSGDREAKAWAQRALMDLIRDLGPYRRPRHENADASENGAVPNSRIDSERQD
jgi:hypothetical protein